MTTHRYDFGGISVAITCDSHPLRQLLTLRYDAFRITKPATGDITWDIVYRLRDTRSLCPQELMDGRKQPMSSTRDGHRQYLSTPTFLLELDHRQRTGTLDGPLATFPIDRMIQAVWSATWEHGLIVHGAAFVDGNRGWLASGPSGSGKSTLAGLFPNEALCDELTAVRLDGIEPRLGALPFWHSRPGKAALCGVYMLRHGTRDQRRRLDPGEAFARLRKEVLWPTYDAEAMRRTFESLAELLAKVPIWELAFRPTQAVWPVISRDAA